MTLRLTPAVEAEELVLDTRFRAVDLARLRLRVDELALIAGLGQPRRAEFVLAMHEVVCNAVRHGGGSGTLRLYQGRDTLRCQVSDEGPGFDEGRVPRSLPDLGACAEGRGLWLVRRMTDSMEVVTDTAGARVTYTMRLGRT
ncbi:ATP-binding protein [Streptomyces goshikiensis]|uniref:ATP-binding protein n=1 Tax=Streptomyces goshikiensis TaxID=1942 RepID=UPI0037B9066E